MHLSAAGIIDSFPGGTSLYLCVLGVHESFVRSIFFVSKQLAVTENFSDRCIA